MIGDHFFCLESERKPSQSTGRTVKPTADVTCRTKTIRRAHWSDIEVVRQLSRVELRRFSIKTVSVSMQVLDYVSFNQLLTNIFHIELDLVFWNVRQ